MISPVPSNLWRIPIIKVLILPSVVSGMSTMVVCTKKIFSYVRIVVVVVVCYLLLIFLSYLWCSWWLLEERFCFLKI